MNDVKDFFESQGDFSLTFEGGQEIDAKTLCITIDNLINMLQGITASENSEAYAKLKIKAIEPGSFDLFFSTVVTSVQNILSKENIEFAGNVIKIVCSIFDIKKHLNGKKAESIANKDGKLVVKNSEGIEKIYPISAECFFKDLKYENCTFNIINVTAQSGISALEIKDAQTGSTVKIDKQDYDAMLKPVVEEKEKQYYQNTVNVDLLLKKPDFLGNSQWTFIYINSIEVKIEDEEWLEKVHKGLISLKAGVRIPCQLKIQQELDEFGMPIESTVKYSLLKVTGDMIQPDDNPQMHL